MGNLRIKFRLLAFALLLWAKTKFVAALGVSENIACGSMIPTYVCLPRNYSSMDIPMTDVPNHIGIEIHISDVLKINDRDFSITFSLYFNVQWREPRLQIDQNFFQNRSIDVDQLQPVDLNLINDLWVPNVFIYNLKTFKVIDVLSKLAGLWVNAKNEIMYSQASQITFICPMIFNYFPLDTQVCKFQVGSYSYNMEKMIFAVSKLGYAHTSRSIVLDYDIAIHKLRSDDRIFEGGSLGNFSLAGFEMILHRHVSHYIINYYLPSGLFVVVSWISFLVPAEIIPGRMALLVTLFLVLVNIFNTVTTNTPKAEGLTAIEAWMLSCILFVFATLAEYACLLYSRLWGSDIELQPPSTNGWDDDCDPCSLATTNCNQPHSQARTPLDNGGGGGTEGTDTTNGVEMRDMPGSNRGSKDGTPEEMTELTEHLRRHTSRHCSARDPRISITRPTTLDPKRALILHRQKQALRHAKIDRFFLILFPLLFLIFNVVYWLAYYYAHPVIKVDAEQQT